MLPEDEQHAPIFEGRVWEEWDPLMLHFAVATYHKVLVPFSL